MCGKRGMRGRKDVMFRAFKMIELFNRGEVTTMKIRNEFNITKQSAQKWIDTASLFLPIYEIRRDGLAKVYGLLK